MGERTEIAKKWTAEHGSKIAKQHGGVIKKGIGLRSRWLKEEK
tara:strand:+ start:553 stop:681 length:129 start_codon:yes stop_codon:yes gene_type:complete